MKIGERYSRTLIVSAAALLMCATGPRAGISGSQASSQSQATVSGPAATAPAANPADVSSIDAILHAAYDTISGPAGRQRDWDRFRSLFVFRRPPGRRGSKPQRRIPYRGDQSGGLHPAR